MMLDEIKKRRAAITSGEWESYMSEIVVNKYTPDVALIAVTNDNSPKRSDDTQFIAHAPADIDWLLNALTVFGIEERDCPNCGGKQLVTDALEQGMSFCPDCPPLRA